MNKNQRAKDTMYFARRWLEEEFTQCRRIKGFLHFLRTSGHMSWRNTSFDFDEGKYTVKKLLRVEINKAMVLNEAQFMEYWIHMGKMIYSFANEHGDEFNQQYMKEKANTYGTVRNRRGDPERSEETLGPTGRFSQEELEGVHGHGGGYSELPDGQDYAAAQCNYGKGGIPAAVKL